MLICKAYKYRIYPTDTQQAKLAVQFGHARYVYNWALDTKQTAYKETQKSLSYYDLTDKLPELKKQPKTLWLKEAASQVLQQKVQDLDTAFKKFFKGETKYPKFKTRYDRQSIRFPQGFKFRDNETYLPKVGWIKTSRHRTLQGTPKNVTVSRTKSGNYYAAVQVEVEHKVTRSTNAIVGIDLGLKDFVTLSTGEKIPAPKHLRVAERRLKMLQRRVSSKQKGSANRTKARERYAKLSEHVSNQRKDFHHKMSHRLVREFGILAFEDLNIEGMMQNHCLAKSIADAGWGQFVKFCEYKSYWVGSEVRKVSRWFPSSQLCSVCDVQNKSLKLSDRTWTCASCGSVHDRDQNAALNLVKEVSTAGFAES